MLRKLKKTTALLLAVMMSLSILMISGSAAEKATTNATYYNMADLAAADPAVMFDPVSGYYYAYSTDGGGRQHYFGIYRSADLVTWELTGGAIPRSTPQWGNDWFWAPECYYNENTGWYFLFYAARIKKGDGALKHFGFSDFEEACKVGVAVSRSPEGPFVNITNEPMDYFPYDPEYYDINQIMPDQNKPPVTLEEGMTAPKGTYLPYIDPNVFFDDDGRIYLYFSRNCYRNWVWDPVLEKYLEESNIYCVELTTDWWNDPEAKTMPTITAEYLNANKAADDPETVRKDGFIPTINYALEPQEWENAHINRVPTNRRWAEGSTTIKYYFDKDGDGTKEPYYYIFYSCNNWENEWYGVGYAVSDSPLGPWNKYDLNPIIALNEDMSGTGHGSLAVSPDGEELFYVYHGRKGTTGSRRLFQDRLTIDETKIDADTGLPTISVLQTVTDQPVPSGVAPYTVVADTDALTIGKGASASINWKVTSSTGAALPLNSSANRIVAEIADPEIATVEGAVVTALQAGQTTLTLQYQRRQADGEYYNVTNTVDGITTDAKLVIPVTVTSATVSEITEATYVNEPFSFQVTTDKAVTKLKLINENERTVGILSATAEPVGESKVWTVTTMVGSAGLDRRLTVYAKEGEYQNTYATVTFDTLKRQAEVKSMEFSAESTTVNQNVTVKIVTNSAATKIKMFNSLDRAMGITLERKTVLENGDVEWIFSICFGTAGIDKEFKAVAGNGSDYNWDGCATDTITVVK